MGVRAILLILSLGVSAGALPADGSPELYGNNASAGRYASINGINLYYEIYGEGQPLLMIHGNNGSIEDFSHQIALFAKHYRVIVADSRGHGRSGLGEGVLSFAAITDDLFELITQLGLKEIRILGWSDGGVAGLRLAIEHPAIVERLAIMGANTQPPEISAYPWAISAVSETRRQVQQKIDAGDDSPELRRELQVLGLLFSDPLISDEQLAKIVAPVLVMAADKDVIVPEHTQRIFSTSLIRSWRYFRARRISRRPETPGSSTRSCCIFSHNHFHGHKRRISLRRDSPAKAAAHASQAPNGQNGCRFLIRTDAGLANQSHVRVVDRSYNNFPAVPGIHIELRHASCSGHY